MFDILERLRGVTKGCRIDMHEPDEQEVSAWVVGSKLDNAFGDSISAQPITEGYQELVVCIRRYDCDGGRTIRTFNLADLIALARLADDEAVKNVD